MRKEPVEQPVDPAEDDREAELCWRVCQYVAVIPIDLHRNAVPTLVREFVEKEGGMAALRERFPDINEDLHLMLVHECVDYLETRLPRAFILDRLWAYMQFKRDVGPPPKSFKRPVRHGDRSR